MRTINITFGILFIMAGAVNIAGANEAIIDFPTDILGWGVGDWWVLGWEFIPTSPITVTDLGFYDYLNDGFATAKPIGLWRASDQNLLASAIVAPGVVELYEILYRARTDL